MASAAAASTPVDPPASRETASPTAYAAVEPPVVAVAAVEAEEEEGLKHY